MKHGVESVGSPGTPGGAEPGFPEPRLGPAVPHRAGGPGKLCCDNKITKEELREASQAGRWEDGGSLSHRSGCLAVAVGVIQPPRPGLFAEKDKLWAAAFRIQQQTANVPCLLERLGANAAHFSRGEMQFPGLGLHLFIYLTPNPLPGRDQAEQRARPSPRRWKVGRCSQGHLRACGGC